MDLDQLKQQINEEASFTRYLGLKATKIAPESATITMQPQKEHLNIFQALHGGVLYTIADLAGGAAAYAHGTPVCTVDSDFHFLNAALNTTELSATASLLKAGKRVLVYDVSVKDQNNCLLCKGTFTYMFIHVPDTSAQDN